MIEVKGLQKGEEMKGMSECIGTENEETKHMAKQWKQIHSVK